MIAVPASASRTGVAPPRPAVPITYTATDASAAPMNANHTELAAPASPSESAITTAAEAPALTPSRPGSASGLRVSACISAPATPIAAPTAIPSSVRGTRRLRMIASSCERAGVQQRVDDVAERDRARADGEAQQRGEREQPEGDGQPGAPGEAAAFRARDVASVTVWAAISCCDLNRNAKIVRVT